MTLSLFRILFAVILPFAVSFLWRTYGHRKIMNKIPGPKGRFIFGSALELLHLPGIERLEWFRKYAEEYGHIFRLWIGFQSAVIVSNAEDAETLLTSRTNINKASAYSFLHPWIGTGLLTSTDLLQANGSRLSAMGTVNGEASMAGIIMERIFSPWLRPNFTFSFTQLFKRQQNTLQIMHTFTLEIINRRKLERGARKKHSQNDLNDLGSTKNKAFLDLLLDISEEDGTKLNDADIREEVDTFMFAGHDTVSSSASWVIYSVGSYSDVQERIFEELYSVFGSSERNPTMKDLTHLKYLESVIKECLRLYPPGFLVARLLSENTNLNGYEIPAGTHAEVDIYCLHRNPKYYTNPDAFDPEHFSHEASSNRHPFAFLPFSAGPRTCIGQKFAMMEEKVLISSLLRRYQIESLQKAEDVAGLPELVLRPGNGIKIKLSKRKYPQ